MDLRQYNKKFIKVDLWIRDNLDHISRFDPGECGNDAIRFDKMLTNVASSVRDGDADALSLAMSFLASDPMAPFGKIVKSHLLRAMRSNPSLLSSDNWLILEDLHEKWVSMKPFPPREIRYLVRLLAVKADS